MNGAELILHERKRQIGVEGWTPEHDAEHVQGELNCAALGYAMFALWQTLDQTEKADPGNPPEEILWPWGKDWWKPSDDPIRNLVKAGALIAAEIDRLSGSSETQVTINGST